MISFDGARTLGYNHTHKYFGENFRYGVVKSLTIEGSIYALTNEEDVQPVWSGISGVVLGATDYDDIILNGVNFGKGRIENLNFAEGDDVKKKNYTATITVFGSGNLFNLTGVYYSGLDLNNSNNPIYLTESFSEDFSFDRDDNGEWLFSQSLSMKFVSGRAIGGSNSPISMAKGLASNLFSSAFPFSVIDSSFDGQYNNTGRQLYTEAYDAITNECSFSRKIKLGTETGCYSVTYTNSLTLDENGVATVSEEGDIQGVCSPYIDAALSGYSTEYGKTFDRLSGMFYAYIPSGYPLIATPLRLRKTVDKFNGKVQYSTTYTNDIKMQTGYSWEYTQEVSRNPNCIYTVAENGIIKGISQNCSPADIYSRALSGFDIVKSGLGSRISGFYFQATKLSNPLNNIAGSQTRSIRRGEVQYGYTFNDDPFSSISGFKKINYSVDDNFPVHLLGKFNIPGVKELIQPQNNTTVGTRSVQLEINGFRDTALTGYLDFAKNYLNQLAPTGDDTFIKGCQYSLNQTNNIFNIECSWSFFDYRAFTDNDV